MDTNMPILELWKADNRLKRVCQNPICGNHAVGLTRASKYFRMALARFSSGTDTTMSANGDAAVEDALVHVQPEAILSKEDKETSDFMVDFVNKNMGDISGDPSQFIRPECSNTLESLVYLQGTRDVFHLCIFQQSSYKTSSTRHRTSDRYDDMPIAIRLDADLRRWLISIGYMNPDPDPDVPNPKDPTKTKQPMEVIIYLLRSIVVAYHARSLNITSAELLGIWDNFTDIVQKPWSEPSLKFAAGVGFAGVKFKEVRETNKRASDKDQQEAGTNNKVSAREHSHLSLGTFHNNIAPVIPVAGDRGTVDGVSRDQLDHRQRDFSKHFDLKNSPLPLRAASRPAIPECVHATNIRVIVGSVPIMNPIIMCDPTKEKVGKEHKFVRLTPMHVRLNARMQTRIKEQKWDGTIDSPVMNIPFPLSDERDSLATLAATEFWTCPTFFDPGYHYHLVTLCCDGEPLQLLVVTKKTTGDDGPMLCFLKQSPGGVYEFKQDNVFVWVMPPVKNSHLKLAKNTYALSAKGYTLAVWRYFAEDYLAAFIVTSKNFEDVRNVIAFEVLRFIDPRFAGTRLRKDKVNNGGDKVIKLGMELKLSQQAVKPFLDIMARKLRLSQNVSANKWALCGLMKSLRDDINTGCGNTLNVDKLLFKLACREDIPVPPPKYSKAKGRKSVLLQQAEVVEKILNVYDQEDPTVSEFPDTFPGLVRKMRLRRRKDMHVAAAEGRLLAGGVGYLQLEAALENKDNVRANELYWQLLGHGAALYGTDASVFTALGNVAQPGLPLALPAPAAGDSGTKPLKRVRVMAREVAEQSDSEDESDSDSEDSAVKKQKKKHVEDEEDEESSEEDDSDSDDDPDNTARCKGKQPMTGVQKAAMKKQEDKGSSSEDDSESDDDPDNTARCKGKQPMTGLQKAAAAGAVPQLSEDDTSEDEGGATPGDVDSDENEEEPKPIAARPVRSVNEVVAPAADDDGDEQPIPNTDDEEDEDDDEEGDEDGSESSSSDSSDNED